MAEAILVADDEAGIRESLAEILRDAGYTVETAADGTAALETIDAHDFAVVITDLRMPGADGLTVLRRLSEVAPQTVPLVMTAHSSIESAVEALRAGAADYLLKPIAFDDVLAKVARVLDHRQLAWQAERDGDPPATAPRPARRHPRPDRVSRPPPQSGDEAGLSWRRQRDVEAPRGAALEGKRARARQRHRARDDPRGRRMDHGRRPSAKPARGRHGAPAGRRRSARRAPVVREDPHRDAPAAARQRQASGGRGARPLLVVALPEDE